MRILKTKKYVLFFICVCFYSLTFAQKECGTKATLQDDIAYKKVLEKISKSSYARLSNKNIKWFPVFVYSIHKSNGTEGASKSDILRLIQELNEDYSSTRIQFYICGEKIVRSDEFFDLDGSAGEFDSYFDDKYIEGVINLHLVGGDAVDRDGEGLSGLAAYPEDDDGWILIGGKRRRSTVAHEFGHHFGLRHTHHNHNADDISRRELVRRDFSRNCHSAGDGLCDTPADPKLDSGTGGNQLSNCTYFGTETDADGNRYSPLTNNFMSYGEKTCRTSFTPDQIDIINENAFNHENRRDMTCRNNDCNTPNLTLNFSRIPVNANTARSFQSDGVINAKGLIKRGYVGLYAARRVVLKPGFRTARTKDAWFEAKSIACSDISVSSSREEELSSFVNTPKFKVYPNPTTGLVNIQLEKDIDNMVEIKVSDILGRNIYSAEKHVKGKSFKLDLSHKTNGTYFLNIKGEEETYRFKLYMSK